MTTSLDLITAAAEIHHEDLRDRLVRHTQSVITAVTAHWPYEPARQDLVDFLNDELLAHTEVEEGLVYTAGENDRTALLVAAMLDEHRMMGALVREIEQATDGIDVALAAGALVVLYDVCVHQENRYLLPALADAGVNLTALVEDVPEIVGTARAAAR
ncbi:hemerythrin domain-containing protein [Blastococcus saxobsidens]|uniref:Hemerythrin-like domain-containing protein n=1 Tax=Blastococcus saxobsidens (strain DD2) TaxID=1146883 RepID=H6RU55_BLASD|nr:hemerythrin domain-containing protein [Blastococcus saxobsidens]CCG05662.1 protein of unknown function [Blastococcus saxobsidens DD2]